MGQYSRTGITVDLQIDELTAATEVQVLWKIGGTNLVYSDELDKLNWQISET